MWYVARRCITFRGGASARSGGGGRGLCGLIGLAAISLLPGLTGCKSDSPPAAAPANQTMSPLRQALASSGGATPTPEDILPSDPSSVRLQDIGGYILLYYQQNKQMPATLDDLRPYVTDADFKVTSPMSGEPYVYRPTGLWAPNQEEKCIIAFDPTPSARGLRLCLFMSMPKASSALSVEVVGLPEQDFERYRG
jgi:hypothetical protein